ncbi:MAG TPA: class I SAM-dependent methyltransferase [Blastocatellia bacterium]
MTEQKQLAVEAHSRQAGMFKAHYDELGNEPYRNCFVYSRLRLNFWLDHLMPERGDGLRLLDVGCGTGYHLARYRERGFEIAGIDGSEEMLKQARAAIPGINFKQGDAESLPFESESFDFALCIEVLRYLPGIDQCVREIARVLKPGGAALVTAAPPLQANLYPLVNRISAAVKIGDLTRLKQFFHSERRLRRAFKEAKFSEIEVHGVYGGPMVWVERISKAIMPALLKAWEKADEKMADAPALKHFSNMFLVCAKKN